MARPAFQPTDEQRKLVEQLAAFGIPQEKMVQMVVDKDHKPIALKTLRKHFALELETGELKANTKVAQCLFKQATDGNVTAQIFWLKTRARWKEQQSVELTGKDGGPVEYAGVSPQQLAEAVKNVRDKF